MKHHEYSLYYGGFKTKLAHLFWCNDCNQVNTKQDHKKLIFKSTKVQQSSNPISKGRSPITHRKRWHATKSENKRLRHVVS